MFRVLALDRKVVRAKGQSQTRKSKSRGPETRNHDTQNPETRHPEIQPFPEPPSTQCPKPGSGGAMTPAKRVGNNLNGFKDFRTGNDSSQGQNLALTGSFVPSSLDSGRVYQLAINPSPPHQRLAVPPVNRPNDRNLGRWPQTLRTEFR